MPHFEDAERRQALFDLLSLPDPPELRHRGHRTTVEGRSNRFQQLSYLTSTFVQSKRIEWEEYDEGAVVVSSPRRQLVAP